MSVEPVVCYALSITLSNLSFSAIKITSYKSDIPCICSHPSHALDHLMLSLLWAQRNIFWLFPALSMMWCFWGKILLWSWCIRSSHRWGGLHDIISLGRHITLGWDARGCRKWGGLGIFWIGIKRLLTASSEYSTILWAFWRILFGQFGSLVSRVVGLFVLGARRGSCLLKIYTTVKLVVLVVARWCINYVVYIYEYLTALGSSWWSVTILSCTSV